jgi:hypothetical protein
MANPRAIPTTDLDGYHPSIRLTRDGRDAVVSIETPIGFVEIIRESLIGWPDVEFDHIVSPSGINAAIERRIKR